MRRKRTVQDRLDTWMLATRNRSNTVSIVARWILAFFFAGFVAGAGLVIWLD